MKVKIGWGKWGSWGFGINYDHYCRALSIDFIHWYFYIEVYKEA